LPALPTPSPAELAITVAAAAALAAVVVAITWTTRGGYRRQRTVTLELLQMGMGGSFTIAAGSLADDLVGLHGLPPVAGDALLLGLGFAGLLIVLPLCERLDPERYRTAKTFGPGARG
jgi:hypothetical protein